MKENWKRFINTHTILALIVVLTILAIVWRYKTWGTKVDLAEISEQETGEIGSDQDYICAVTDENGKKVEDTDGVTTILFLGNSSFANDRNSEDGLVSMIAAGSGATVYNCAVGESYLSAVNYVYDEQDAPMDAFSFYWLASYLTIDSFEGYFTRAEEAMGEEYPEDAIEAYRTLQSVDMDTVDVIAIMYDAADYLGGREVGDPYGTTIMTYAGALNAGCALIREAYPTIRIIVMGPTYAYAIDEDGNYTSSSIYCYSENTILPDFVYTSVAVCMSQSITFVDDLFGAVTEDNADQYLLDNVHLNTEGRKLVANRFLEALTYYD